MLKAFDLIAVQGDDYECDGQTADDTGGGLRAVSHDRRCPSCPSRPWQTFRNTHAEDWIWLILLGGMMLAIYYFAGVYLEDEEEITEEFLRLDRDHDGFISREDAKNWPELSREFDKFDRDHDGRLSHNDFELFEKARPAH
jgi:hypothetical protein